MDTKRKVHLLALGLNHESAPIRIREQAAVTTDLLGDALRELTTKNAVEEATILSTCNRTEIYCHQQSDTSEQIITWLCNFHGLSQADISPYLYRYPDAQAVRHAFRVAAGLDSMVLGEPQILGQMKEAFAIAHKTGVTGKILNRLFQQTFTVAKRVRTDTAIGTSAVSVAYAAVSLAKQIFSDLSQQTVLMIGAGETIELTARHLKENGVKHLIVANRTLERARNLAQLYQAEAISLDELPARLSDGDIVISSTASTLPILGKGAVESALKKRRHRPMFMVDLAVPRDIEPEVAELNDVFLYTVDDLRGVIEENLQARKAAAEEAEQIIDVHTEEFMGWLHSLNAVPTIKALRQSMDRIVEAELQRAYKKLQSGEDANAVVQQLANSLSKKFTHSPTEQLTRSDSDGTLSEAVRRLFKLES
ncbi:MAG: glutamyl-tRNA reductase [Arenicellales bacterium]|nr:glutamyl-tRNA reductase [Arenicellales bacterium]